MALLTLILLLSISAPYSILYNGVEGRGTLLEPLQIRRASGDLKCPGKCLPHAKCLHAKGMPDGFCVDGSICCQFHRSCDGHSNELTSYFHSPHFPLLTNSSGICSLQLTTLPLITHLKLDFLVFDLHEPSHYAGGVKCIMDSLFILNGSGGAQAGICAMANYSRVLTVNESTTLTLAVITQSTGWRWRIKLTQLNATRAGKWQNNPQCGRQLMYDDVPLANPQSLQPLIVNGEMALGSEFPWQVSIQVQGMHRCGGSIISPRLVLSAAHCFAEDAYWGDLKTMTVAVGAVSLNDSALLSIPILSVVIHHDYHAYDSHQNDFALLYLAKDIVFNPFVQPVCLPEPDGGKEDGDGWVSGWGRLNGTAGRARTMDLQKMRIRVLNRTECIAEGVVVVRRLTANKSSEFDISESQLCGLAPRNGTVCFGDSGGPLVIQSPTTGSFTQVGIVSFGFGPCLVSPSYPVIYTRVSSFLSLIAILADEDQSD